ncbi:MAG: hypothetical protein WA125_05690 [Desulfosporosinus sp.]
MDQRHETAIEVQNLLTQYGCFIGTRVGLHQTSTDFCSEQGLIILEFINDAEKEAQELEKALSTVNNVKL